MINHPFGEPQDPSSKDKKGEYNQAGRKIGNHFLKDIDIDDLLHTTPDRDLPRSRIPVYPIKRSSWRP
jgi:hypothetical protein